LNCNGRTNIINKPNKDDGYCQFFTQLNHVDFGDFDSTGPIYVGIKLTGSATVKVTTKQVITLPSEEGSVKTQYTDIYQPYKYQTETIGYILIKATAQNYNNDIQLYHNTEDCKRNKTTYPRQSHYCVASSGKGNVSLTIPSTLGNVQLHYFGVQIGTLDRVEFNYDFVPITEVEINQKNTYNFDPFITTPFQVKVKKGKYIIIVQTININECNIYADYDGCAYGLKNNLPNKRNYCLSSTYDKSKGNCTLSFNMIDDGVVYFGVDTATKRFMDVSVKSNPKLTFLE
jgi:hypothetical protein